MSFIPNLKQAFEKTETVCDVHDSCPSMAATSVRVPVRHLLRSGRKPFNATGERDSETGRWIVDPSIVRARFAPASSGPVVPLLRPGRKPWNATGKRDKVTGKWELDLTLVKPTMVVAVGSNKRKHAPEERPTKRLGIPKHHSYLSDTIQSVGDDVSWNLDGFEELDFFRVFN